MEYTVALFLWQCIIDHNIDLAPPTSFKNLGCILTVFNPNYYLELPTGDDTV